jgi:hypothetical protein
MSSTIFRLFDASTRSKCSSPSFAAVTGLIGEIVLQTHLINVHPLLFPPVHVGFFHLENSGQEVGR